MGLKYRAALFDIYGTLAGFDPPRETVQANVLSEYGIEAERHAVGKGYIAADRLLAEQNAREPLSSLNKQQQDDFFARYEQTILASAGHKVNLGLALRIWRSVRESGAKLALFDDVLPALNRLKQEGVRCGVISNINRNGDELLESLGLSDVVEFALTSGDTGVSKPDRRIFQLAVQKTDANAFYAGDQLQHDVIAAENAGVRGVLIDRHNAHPNHTAHPRFQNLRELVRWLEDG